MGLANWLTVLRILLVPVFVTLLVYRRPGPAVVVFAAAAFTDLLDGWWARRHGLQSRLGAFLDPLADKLLLTASFIMLTILKVVPFWFTAVVLSRDAFLALGTLLIHMIGARVYPRPTWVGKAATFLQVLTVLVGLLGYYWGVRRVWPPLLWIAATFTLVSGLQYLVQGMRFVNAAQDAERESTHDELYRL
ncbi:MAG TPA: CDP-diacylglycerol--glycerol-3-phosphate 3-phosphatidyltransferase [Terriglobales bacterium]|nr:CDP-diacylglycerol--glycerol-3-phosphate 3-phosphatidyltransferase [Terriglobales bacterium]